MAERERRVAGEVFFRKGHMVLDCRRTVSMVAVVGGGMRVCLEFVKFAIESPKIDFAG